MSIPITVTGAPAQSSGKTHLEAPLSAQQHLHHYFNPSAIPVGSCDCYWDIPGDQDEIELAIGKTRLAIGIIADSLCGIDFTQWSGIAAQTCQDKVQGVCTLISAVDDELQETRHLITITGDISS